MEKHQYKTYTSSKYCDRKISTFWPLCCIKVYRGLAIKLEVLRENASKPYKITRTQNVFKSEVIKHSFAFEILLYNELNAR